MSFVIILPTPAYRTARDVAGINVLYPGLVPSGTNPRCGAIALFLGEETHRIIKLIVCRKYVFWHNPVLAKARKSSR